jgi:hypothetical protein
LMISGEISLALSGEIFCFLTALPIKNTRVTWICTTSSVITVYLLLNNRIILVNNV